MAHLIDKDALVAEIERRIADNKKDIERASYKNLEDYFEGYEDALVLFKKKFLDTLEVKEVDLEKEIQMFSMNLAMKENNGDWEKDIAVTAKHFYELGLAASNKARKGEEV